MAEIGQILVIALVVILYLRFKPQKKPPSEIILDMMPDMSYDCWQGDCSLIKLSQNTMDVKLRDLCRHFAGSSADRRAGIRVGIVQDECYELITFSKRSAVFAMRKLDVQHVNDGLKALAMIEIDRVDYRDVVLALALLYHSAEKIGTDAEKLFLDAFVFSDVSLKKLIADFVNDKPENRDIRLAWGYGEVITGDGIGFIGWGFGVYAPTYDLKKLIVEISELIEADKYYPGRIELASELAPYWLSNVNDDELYGALKTVKACASISAELRPGNQPENESHSLMVFLLELGNGFAANTLFSLSQRRIISHRCMIGAAKGRLFYLIITTSARMGVDTFETTDSLDRFTKGIGEILERELSSK